MKLSPDLWVDLKRSLPLLSNSEYFEKLKHGYARGGEAVLLTEFVRTYYNILLQQEPLALGILHPPVVLSQVRLIDKQSY